MYRVFHFAVAFLVITVFGCDTPDRVSEVRPSVGTNIDEKASDEAIGLETLVLEATGNSDRDVVAEPEC